MIDPRVSVVVLTHQRPVELQRTLQRLWQLPEQPPIIVVDNASTPGTVDSVVRVFPHVELVRCERNRGAAGRNEGVARVRTPYVAFCDDDTWWEAGSLRSAADLLDTHPRLAAVAARVLVGPDQRTDPTCERMMQSPLHCGDLPGPALIAFMAGAVVMRTDAYLEVGGYERRLFLGAEEILMGLDLWTHGWRIVYSTDVATHHHPSRAGRDPTGRRIAEARNRLWIALLRLPLATAWRDAQRIMREAARAGVLTQALRQTVPGLPWALLRRRPIPPEVDKMYRLVFTPRKPMRSRLGSSGRV
jgi:GT2 family glycosyltransferase